MITGPNPSNLTQDQLAALSPAQLQMYQSVGWYTPTPGQIAANYNAGPGSVSSTGPITGAQITGQPPAPPAAPPAAAATQSNIPRDTTAGPATQPFSLSNVAPNVQTQPYGSPANGGSLLAGFSGLPAWLQQLYQIPNLPAFAPNGMPAMQKGGSSATPQDGTTSPPTGTGAGGVGLPNVPGWLQGLTNYGLPIAATLYGGLNLSNAYGNASQQAAAAATGAGTEVNNTAQAAATGIEGAATGAATGVTQAGQSAISGVNPYAAAGAGAVNSLSQMAAKGGFQFDPSQLATDPTYQFELQQGELAGNRQLAAQGLEGSGAAVKDAAQFAQGLASTDVNNIYGRQLQTYQTNVNNLENLAGAGQTASQYQGNTGLTAAQGAGTFGYQGALEGGDFGLQGSSYQGNANTQAGLDLATGTIGSGIAQATMANQIANILLQPQQPGQMGLAQILAGLFKGGGSNG